MLRNIAHILFLLAGFASFSFGQNCDSLRYVHSIFEVDTMPDVVFGNAPALPAVYVGEPVTVPQDLLMDVFQPRGDTLARRPLLLFAFGGGFLIGSKDDEDVYAAADSFARKGFVTASINYRLGMNVADNASAERALYRGVQDVSAAIRYFKEFADSFRLDTNYFFSAGVSAGSFSNMHLQYMTDAQRPPSTFASGLPFNWPDLGCKDCSGNLYKHSSTVKALVNLWGAIGDTSWIDPQDSVPLLSFHGDQDPTVPFDYGFPFTVLFSMPPVFGSSLIAQRMQNIGLPNTFVPFPGEGHNVWGTVVNNNFVGGPTQHWEPILQDMQDFLYPFLQPEVPVVSGPVQAGIGDTLGYAAPFTAGSFWCWEIDGGTVTGMNAAGNQIDVRWDSVGLQTLRVQEENRFLAVSGLGETTVAAGVTGWNERQNESQIEVYPNPAQAGLVVRGTNWGNEQLHVELQDFRGRIVWKTKIETQNGAFHHRITPQNLSGMYILHIRSANFVRAEKVIFRP